MCDKNFLGLACLDCLTELGGRPVTGDGWYCSSSSVLTETATDTI